MEAVQRFSKNAKGRDFFAGDVHGCFDALREALAAVQFDEENDRLFMVGDLVDRGTQNEEALDWLAKSFVWTVRGNHEEMVVDAALTGIDRRMHEVNGAAWFYALTPERQRVYAAAFNELPYALEIETADGFVGVVHAEVLHHDWGTFAASVRDMDQRTLDVTIWGRHRVTFREKMSVGGVQAIVVGHTPLENVRVLGNTVYIDTGTVYQGGKLTLLPLEKVLELARSG